MGKLIAALLWIAFIVACIAAWVTHIVISLKALFAATTTAATIKAVVILVGGALIAFLGVIHGAGHWFGWW